MRADAMQEVPFSPSTGSSGPFAGQVLSALARLARALSRPLETFSSEHLHVTGCAVALPFAGRSTVSSARSSMKTRVD